MGSIELLKAEVFISMLDERDAMKIVANEEKEGGGESKMNTKMMKTLQKKSKLQNN